VCVCVFDVVCRLFKTVLVSVFVLVSVSVCVLVCTFGSYVCVRLCLWVRA
jgi:hypothetical protein